MTHEEERQALLAELELLADELKPEFRHRMLGIILKYWKLVERAESDGAVIDNVIIQAMIEKLRDR
jgi:hypothetical protein